MRLGKLNVFFVASRYFLTLGWLGPSVFFVRIIERGEQLFGPGTIPFLVSML